MERPEESLGEVPLGRRHSSGISRAAMASWRHLHQELSFGSVL